jgi:hypothetical protein
LYGYIISGISGGLRLCKIAITGFFRLRAAPIFKRYPRPVFRVRAQKNHKLIASPYGIEHLFRDVLANFNIPFVQERTDSSFADFLD